MQRGELSEERLMKAWSLCRPAAAAGRPPAHNALNRRRPGAMWQGVQLWHPDVQHDQILQRMPQAPDCPRL